MLYWFNPDTTYIPQTITRYDPPSALPEVIQKPKQKKKEEREKEREENYLPQRHQRVGGKETGYIDGRKCVLGKDIVHCITETQL